MADLQDPRPLGLCSVGSHVGHILHVVSASIPCQEGVGPKVFKKDYSDSAVQWKPSAFCSPGS